MAIIDGRSGSTRTVVAGSYFAITGVAELDATLSGMETKLRNQAVRKATRAAAKLVLAKAQELVPEDSGDLAESLKVVSAATHYVTRGGQRKRSKKYRGLIGHGVRAGEGLFKGDQFYAGFVEFGTGERATKSRSGRVQGANRGRIEPDKFAFLRPALYATEAETRTRFRVEVMAWLREQSRRAAGGKRITRAPEVYETDAEPTYYGGGVVAE